jgi:hypothetical protein
MSATDLAIRIATTMDATGINKADKSVNNLQKSTVKLGRALGVALSTAAIVAYGKSAVRAFANAEAQQERLVRLLKVGVGATDLQIESLNKQAKALENVGVVGAGTVTQVQSQLATFNLQASTIAALTPAILDYVTAEKGATATTEEFKTATNGLAQALNGNFTSLTRVGFVIDQTTRDLIKNGTEAQRAAAIVQVLDSTYKGFNASLRDTAAGGLQLLSNAADTAKEAIGESLVDAFARVSGGSEASDAVQTIESVTKGIQTLIDITGTAVGGLVSLYKALDFITSLGGLTGADGLLVQRFGRQPAVPSTNRSASPAGTALRMRQEREQKALAATAAKREKERLALLKKQELSQKKLTAEQKKQAALKKAGTVFDLEQIELVAALQGRLSKDEENRVKAQLALLSGNVAVATELTQKILLAQDASGNLAKFLAALPNARNPFEYLEEYLDRLAKKAAKVLAEVPVPTASPQVQAILALGDQAAAEALAAAAEADEVIKRLDIILNTVPNFTPPPAGTYGTPSVNPFGPPATNASVSGVPVGQAWSPGFSMGGNTTPGTTFTLKITGEGDITNAIAKGLQNQSLSTGTTTTINRSGGFL